MIALVAVTLAAAAPLPAARERINCPFVPIFFESGRRDIDAAGRHVLANNYDWVLDRSREDVRIVLTTATREPDTVALGPVSQARAEAVRAALIEEGIPAEHIMVAHDFRSGPNYAPEGWAGGWVYLDFYVSPSVWERIRPPGNAVC